MHSEDRLVGYRLLEAAASTVFRITSERVRSEVDEGEFAVRFELQFEPDRDSDKNIEDRVEQAGIGFVFALAVLSFADARPRGCSGGNYRQDDEFRPADLIECLKFSRGELRFNADSIRGRRMNTDIVLRSNGTVTLQTFGRGRAAFRWLESLQGKKFFQRVDASRLVN